MRRGILILTGMLILLTAKNIHAKEEKILAPKYDLGAIIVTATKTEAYQAEVGSSSTIITAEDLEKTGSSTVLEALRDVPGVTITQNGAFGGSSSIYLRGSKPGHTLVLIDGVEVNDPMSADRSFDFAHLTTDNIERIEVVRGPQSTLYGSDAIGGVVNIITKKGRGKPKFEVSLEGGSHNTFKENISLSGSAERVNYSFSLSRLNSDGISKATGGAEKDGYENTALSSRIGYRIFGDSELNFTLRYTDSETDLDDSAYEDDPNYLAWWKNFATKLSFNQTVYSWWNHNLVFSYNNLQRKYRDEPDSVDLSDNRHNWYKGDNKKLEWQHNFTPVESDTITVGFEYEEERGFSDGRASWDRFDRMTVNNKGYYLQNQLRFRKKFFTTLGIRVDDHQLFGTEATYKVSSAYLIPERGTGLKANWGTGFKAPSLYQLYSSYGSPNLKPDESKGYDFGIEQSLLDGKVSFGATYFHNAFKNMVDYDLITSKYKNIGRAETEGFETDFSFKPIETVTTGANYTYTKTKDKNTGKKLIRRPENQIGLTIDWGFRENGNLNLSVNYIGHSWNNSANTEKVKPYTRADLSASYRINRDVWVFGRIENLFDRTYQEVLGYAMPGISFYTGAKITF